MSASALATAVFASSDESSEDLAMGEVEINGGFLVMNKSKDFSEPLLASLSSFSSSLLRL